MENSVGNVVEVRFGADSIIGPLGFGTAENLSAVISGRLGVSRDDSGEISDGVIMAGRISGERLGKYADELGLTDYSKLVQLVILAIEDVLVRSRVDIKRENCGIIISTTKGEITSIASGGEDIPLWQTAEEIACHFGMSTRDVMVISNACISGVSAIVTAGRLIRERDYESVIVVGIDLLSHFITSGFGSFRSLSEELCLPYDNRRCGLNLGEACGAVLLTGKAVGSCAKSIFDNKKEEGGGVMEEIFLLGGAISNDANHISGPSRTGDGLFFAMQSAMSEAGIESGAIDTVNLHGTATVFNDEMESKAMQLAGLDGVPVNSLKPYFGHTLGASGVIETIILLYQIRNGTIYAVPGYKECGVSVSLNISNEHRILPKIDYALKTASGFGGCNAAIVISRNGKFSEPFAVSSLKMERRCMIEGGKITLNGEDVFCSKTEDFHLFIREAFKFGGDGNMKFYKMDNLCKLGYMATSILLDGIELNGLETAIILSNSSSSLDTDIKHQKNIDEDENEGASPAVFVYTLPNIVAGEICIKYKIRGENTFFVTKEFLPEMIERHILSLAKYAGTKQVVYGWCEYTENSYKADIRYGTIN